MITAVRKRISRHSRQVRDAFEGLETPEIERAMLVLQQAAGPGDATFDSQSAQVKAAVQGVRTTFDAILKDAAAVHLFGEAFVAPNHYFPIVMDLREDGARERLEALYRKPRYKAAVLDAANTKDYEAARSWPATSARCRARSSSAKSGAG